MLIKRFPFLRLSLDHCQASLLFFGIFVLTFNQAQAETYFTAPLDFTAPLLKQLSWTINFNTEASTSSQEFQLAFLPLESNATTADSQILNNYTCQKKDYVSACTLPLETFSQPGKFRFQYPTGADFYLNFQLQQAPTQEIFPQDDRLLTYGPMKIISSSLNPTQISWQELSYNALNQATSSAQNLIIQYRSASASAQAWSSWKGNFSSFATLPATNFTSTVSAELWSKITLPTQKNAFLQLQYFTFDQNPIQFTYQKNGQKIITQLPHHQLSLAQPVAIGNQEEEAFSKTTFYLQDLQDLQIGQDLLLKETVNQITYQIRGTIIDLKASTGLVTVNHWQGAIPSQNSSLCQSSRFCFSTQAKIALVEDFLLELSQPAKNPSIFTNFQLESEQPFSIALLETQINQVEPSLCLEKERSFCTLQGLNLAFSSPPNVLQYRLINFHPQTVKLENIFLHQNSLLATKTDSTFHYLRHGKTLDQSGVARPYFW